MQQKLKILCLVGQLTDRLMSGVNGRFLNFLLYNKIEIVGGGVRLMSDKNCAVGYRYNVYRRRSGIQPE